MPLTITIVVPFCNPLWRRPLRRYGNMKNNRDSLTALIETRHFTFTPRCTTKPWLIQMSLLLLPLPRSSLNLATNWGGTNEEPDIHAQFPDIVPRMLLIEHLLLTSLMTQTLHTTQNRPVCIVGIKPLIIDQNNVTSSPQFSEALCLFETPAAATKRPPEHSMEHPQKIWRPV